MTPPSSMGLIVPAAAGGGGDPKVARNFGGATVNIAGYVKNTWLISDWAPVVLEDMEIGDWVEISTWFSPRLTDENSALYVDIVSTNLADEFVSSWATDDTNSETIGISGLVLQVGGPGGGPPYGFSHGSASAVRQLDAADIRADGSVHITHRVKIIGTVGIQQVDRVYLHAKAL